MFVSGRGGREQPAPSGGPDCDVLNHGGVLKSLTWSRGHSRRLLSSLVFSMCCQRSLEETVRNSGN